MSTAYPAASKTFKTVYRKIPFEARIQLVQLVLKSQFTISKAASKLRIALSTAKLIVKRYKETGTYFLRHEEMKRFKKMLGNKKKVEEYRPSEFPVEQTSENQDPPLELEAEGQTATTDAIYAPFFWYFQSFPNFQNVCFWGIY